MHCTAQVYLYFLLFTKDFLYYRKFVRIYGEHLPTLLLFWQRRKGKEKAYSKEHANLSQLPCVETSAILCFCFYSVLEVLQRYTATTSKENERWVENSESRSLNLITMYIHILQRSAWFELTKNMSYLPCLKGFTCTKTTCIFRSYKILCLTQSRAT
jgi:hypothetical protein